MQKDTKPLAFLMMCTANYNIGSYPFYLNITEEVIINHRGVDIFFRHSDFLKRSNLEYSTPEIGFY